MKLKDLVAEEAIVTELASTDRDEVIAELVDAAISAGAADPGLRDDLVKRLLDREHKSSTGFGRGVAVPHTKHPDIKGLTAAIGLSKTGIEFASLDRQPVYTVFLLLSPEDQPEEHLQAMEAIFKNLNKDTFRRFLRQATTRDDVVTVLDEADNQQLA